MAGYPLEIAPVEVILAEAAANDLTVFVDAPTWGMPTACERIASRAGCRVVMCGVRYPVLSEALACMKRCEFLYLETAKLAGPDCLRITCDEVGAERVCFGTGAPFNYAMSMRLVAEHQGLSAHELEWIASKTTLSLLRGPYAAQV
jgi:predicted TIM-barrel fold metal-dependent hydrolase